MPEKGTFTSLDISSIKKKLTSYDVSQKKVHSDIYVKSYNGPNNLDNGLRLN